MPFGQKMRNVRLSTRICCRIRYLSPTPRIAGVAGTPHTSGSWNRSSASVSHRASGFSQSAADPEICSQRSSRPRCRRRRERGSCPASASSPNQQFASSASPARELDVGESLTTMGLSDVMPYVNDLLGLFQKVAQQAEPRTQLVINLYSHLWRPLLASPNARGEAGQADI
jgi:hypothetical protein